LSPCKTGLNLRKSIVCQKRERCFTRFAAILSAFVTGEKMINQKVTVLVVSIVVIVLVVGFVGVAWNTDNADSDLATEAPTPQASATGTPETTTPTQTTSSTSTPSTTNTPAATPTVTDTPFATSTPTTTTPTNTPSTTPASDNTDYAEYIATSSASTTTVDQTLANNQKDHEETQDYTYSNSDIITITLNGNSISTSNTACVTISSTTATITAAGTYSISGTLTDGQIIVNAPDKATVRLILNGATITSTTNAPIFSETADKVIIILATGTSNTLTDNAANQNDGALYSKTDLTITGDGALTVTGNANDAIRSSDGLIIKSGNIKVTSVDDGIIGKDYIVIKGGTITVNSAGDGLKSDNDENATRGYIYITAGTLTITTTNGDAISAETDLLITGGTITATSGGGSNGFSNSAISTKGLKGNVAVVIDNGNFNINSLDDAIHSNGTIILNNGQYSIATGDDAVHADASLEVNGGAFVISKCYEGMESAEVTINNGYIQIDASDDGLNAAGGNDGSSMDWFPRQGGMPGQGGGFPTTGTYHLAITGGYIYIDADGDGIDINGYIEMSGGILIINGPTSNMDGAIDYDSSFKVTGGTIIAVGSAGMAMAPSTTSTVNSVLINFNQAQSAGKLISIQTASGEVLVTFSPTKTYQSIELTSTELTAGTYNVYLGGTSTGTLTHSMYENGSYSGGTIYKSFTITSTITTVR
jgi:hypothetical protein